MKIKKALVVASTCLLCFPLLFSPVIETSMHVFAIDNSVELTKEAELLDPLTYTHDYSSSSDHHEETATSEYLEKQEESEKTESEEVSNRATEYRLELIASPPAGGNPRRTDSAGSNVVWLRVGDNMGNMRAFPNPGYRFLHWEVASGPIFIFSPNSEDLSVSQREAGNSVIRAVFEPVQGGNVTVKHEDKSGNQIADPSVLTGLVDQTYTTEALSISGWELSKIPENASGTFRVEEQTVVYTYEPEHEQNLWGTVPWSYEEGTETITLYGGEAGARGDAPWKTYSSVKQIIVDDQVILPENSESLFSNLSNLEVIENIDRLDVSNVINMRYMFSFASSLTELDLNNWNISNVTDIGFMFNGASSLKILHVCDWDTSNVTDMSVMFQNASSLAHLDISSWNTSKVTNTSFMFQFASSITELDLGNWNTSALFSTMFMFNGAKSLTKLDISNWNTASLIVVAGMFANTSLKTIVLGEKTIFPPSGSQTNLPEIEITNQYTGRWILEESLTSGTEVIAFENSTEFMAMYDGTHPGTYTWEVKNVNPVDPLDPATEVEPENKPEVPENQGRLSLDFVSQFNFGTQKISVSDQTYYAQPQRLLNENGTVDEIAERPNYVQISDRRQANERNGWQLSVTQNGQFRNESEHELIGTEIQLFNQELVTVQGGASPKLQEEPVQRILPNTRKILLQSEGESGTGTWIYRFGDADTAEESVALNVPKGSNPEATSYSTKLTWELSSVPDN
ncbi:WxL domain-containing protein [Enterococcus spodopteracolus]|uniref:WxL domain-containing protein n=1 Tax=Enterococcus spodopteracolus TaxID=3034501 RepID=UPI0026478C13|nr:WxL domain-containing protein [Enterococcus spodopteracolus]